MLGTRLGPYELLQELGTGGMATVYRAFQPNMERQVAVKVIHRAVANEAGLERFQREARLVARLEHPHILPVYDYNGTHDPPYIVMRYLPGGTLRERLTHYRGPMPVAEVTYLLKQITSALDYAHRHSVIHRDLKPSNIMIDEDRNAFLTDFGVARLVSLVGPNNDLTQSGTTMGTPNYMAPEQAMGAEDIGPQADLYSLAVMVFEMLTGRLPFEGDTPVTVMLKHIQDLPPSPSRLNPALKREVDPVLLRALGKHPTDRFATAAEFASALFAALKVLHSGPLPSFPTPGPKLSPPALPGTSILTAREVASREAAAQLRTEAYSAAAPLLRPSQQQNKQVTVLYADLAEFERTLYDVTDADVDTLRGTLRQVWAAIETALTRHGGVILRRTPRSLTVVWGAEAAREDDPERAVHTALDLREATRHYALAEALPLQIGLTTGAVVLVNTHRPTPAASGETSELTAFGPALSIAGRLAFALPDGGVAITHDLYRLVRGAFDVELLPPLRMRGHKDPLDAYLVQLAKPRAARASTRGVEGIETRLVGREGEYKQLQEAFETAAEAEAQFVLLLGDTGVGKTRLTLELQKWLDQNGTGVRLFRGRATPGMAAQPYALLRDVFMFRFEIQDNDRPAVVQNKLEQQLTRALGADGIPAAHFIGQLVGFDFADSPHLRHFANDPAEFHNQALRYLTRYFEAATHDPATAAVWLLVEDLHWADDKSLEALQRLARDNAETRLLIVGAARPTPTIEAYRRTLTESLQRAGAVIELRPLSKRDSRRLVKEILQKVPALPDELRDLVVDRAEGNPLYIEELVKAFIEDRVIIPSGEQWKVETERLKATSVPPTLVGVLQARLDSLTPDERTLLQRAAVFGRVFWDKAVTTLETGDGLPIDIPNGLRALHRKGLIYPSESSAFARAQEYVFASNLLRDVAYASAYKRQQQAYHAVAAHWLVEASGESGRSLERASLIAEHYERAGAGEQAAKYLTNAAQQALRLSAYDDAKAFLARALPFTVEETLQRAAVLQHLGHACRALGEFAAAEEHYQASRAIYTIHQENTGLADSWLGSGTVAVLHGAYGQGEEHLQTSLRLYRELNNVRGVADVLLQLAAVKRAKGDYPAEEDCLNECLPIYRQTGNRLGVALTLTGLSILARAQGHYADSRLLLEEGLTLYRELGNQREIAFILNNLGYLAGLQEDYPAAEKYLRESINLARALGDKWALGSALNQLGYVYSFQGQFATAADVLGESLELCRSIHDQWGVSVCLTGLGRAALGAGDAPLAYQHFTAAFQIALQVPVLQVALEDVLGLAQLAHRAGQPARAAQWLSLLLHHPALRHENRVEAEALAGDVRATLTAETWQTAYDVGKTLALETCLET